MGDRPFTEAEAARKLNISKATLARERLAGRIHPVRIGQRVIRYTDDILTEYIEQCRNTPARSATTGSASAAGRTTGAAPGMTPPVDRQGAKALALQTFKKAS